MSEVQNVESATDNVTPAAETVEKGSSAEEKPFYNEGHVRKIIEEKRAVLAERDAAKDELKKLQLEKLQKEENWKAIAENSEKEMSKYKEEVQRKNMIIAKGVKTSALKKELMKLGCQEKFLDKAVKLADIDNIQYDEETNVVTGHSELAKQLTEDVPPFFAGATVGVSQGSPAGIPSNISLEQYKAMPPGPEKEKAKEVLYAAAGWQRRK